MAAVKCQGSPSISGALAASPAPCSSVWGAGTHVTHREDTEHSLSDVLCHAIGSPSLSPKEYLKLAGESSMEQGTRSAPGDCGERRPSDEARDPRVDHGWDCAQDSPLTPETNPILVPSSLLLGTAFLATGRLHSAWKRWLFSFLHQECAGSFTTSGGSHWVSVCPMLPVLKQQFLRTFSFHEISPLFIEELMHTVQT